MVVVNLQIVLYWRADESYHLPRVTSTITDVSYSIHDQLFISVYMEPVPKVAHMIGNGIEVAMGITPMSLVVARVNTLQ